MTTLPPRVRPHLGQALLLLALAARGAWAQTQAPPPPPPPQSSAPRLDPPPGVTAPARPPAAAQPTAASRPVLSAPVAPVDSARPRIALRAGMPVDAVAMCQDGAYIAAPGTPADCAAHRGLAGTLPLAPASQAPPAPPRPVSVPQAAVTVSAAPAPPPSGATMLCRDGTYLFGAPAESRCDANGGTAAILPAPTPAPAPPSRPRRP